MKINVIFIINVIIMLTLMISFKGAFSLTSSNSIKMSKKRIIINKFKNDSRIEEINNQTKEKKVETMNSERKLTDENENNVQIQFLEKNNNYNSNNNSNLNKSLIQSESLNQNSFLNTDIIKSMLSNDKTINNVSFDFKDNSNSIINENINELKKMKIFDKYKLSLNAPKETDIINSIKSIDKDIVLKGLDFAKKISHDIELKRQERTGNKCVCPENVIFCDCDEVLVNQISEDKPEVKTLEKKDQYSNKVKNNCTKKNLCEGSENCSCKCNCLWETNDGKECVFNLLEFDFSNSFCDCPCLQTNDSNTISSENITKDYVLDFLKNADLSNNKSIDEINKMNRMVQNQKNISYNKILEYNKSFEFNNDNGNENNEKINKSYLDMYSKGLESIKLE